MIILRKDCGKMKNSQENLESLIEAINELLNEVRKEQITEKPHHKRLSNIPINSNK